MLFLPLCYDWGLDYFCESLSSYFEVEGLFETVLTYLYIFYNYSIYFLSKGGLEASMINLLLYSLLNFLGASGDSLFNYSKFCVFYIIFFSSSLISALSIAIYY